MYTHAHTRIYTGSSKSPAILKYHENDQLYRKIYKNKVVGFKN